MMRIAANFVNGPINLKNPVCVYDQLSCPTVFKVIDPALFEVSQYILTRAIVGRTHTEDSARQNARF